MSDNPFSTTFGIEPSNYIDRSEESKNIIEEFSSETPSNLVYLISGLRGSGKTVFMSAIADYFARKEDWVVVDPGPKDNILENVASEIYETGKMKHAFLKGEFSFSFQGLTFSLKGETPVSTVNTLLKKMLDVLSKKNKKVLITIDEADNSEQMKLFIQAYQSLIRQKYQIRLLMTGPYENVSKLQEERSLTFLYRAPKILLGPLSLSAIAANYIRDLGVNKETSVELAKLTKGYAYAYQTLGYLLYKRNKRNIDDEILAEYDQYLADYVYEKVYSGLSAKEQVILKAIGIDSPFRFGDISKVATIDPKTLSVYRDRLIKRGLLLKTSYGFVQFALPRFSEFLLFK